MEKSLVTDSRSHNILVSELETETQFPSILPKRLDDISRNCICEITIKTDIFKPLKSFASSVIPYLSLIIIS